MHIKLEYKYFPIRSLVYLAPYANAVLLALKVQLQASEVCKECPPGIKQKMQVDAINDMSHQLSHQARSCTGV
eukprot:scaffold285470_cov19-Tisochrysis_lutea.AAC.1